MRMHHIMAFTLVALALSLGSGAVAIGQMTIILEFSTLPINYRSLMHKEEWGTWWGMGN